MSNVTYLKLCNCFVFVFFFLGVCGSLDDITPPDEEQQMCTSFESLKTLNHETGLIREELDIREQLNAPVNATEYSLADDVSASSGLAGQEEGS